MNENIAAAIEIVLGDKSLTFVSYLLVIVTAMDAEVGRRIYTRMTHLIVILSTKVSAKPVTPTEPEPIKVSTPPMARNTGHW